MTDTGDFWHKSYLRHSANVASNEQSERAQTWLTDDTVDAWRHRRMYETLRPVLVPGEKWLTVGDGSFGNDAHYLHSQHCDVVATDISDALLRQAHEMGRIPAYQAENAEHLSFADNSFDYVMCKEAYHHFPRPAMALYEMIRVARKGVALIEPNDQYITERLRTLAFLKFKEFVKRILGNESNRNSFEEVGNYLYAISRREVEKVAMGVGCPVVAYKGINDAYQPGVEEEKLGDSGPLQRRIRRSMNLRSALCGLGLMDYGLLTVLIFRHPPDNSILGALRGASFEVHTLPANPYL